MSRFVNFLKNKNFSLLWVGQVVSQFGDRLTQMALIALIFKMAPGSSMGLAKLMFIMVLPVFIVGPLAGVYVDRWDRRRTMYVSDIIRAFLIFLVPFFFMHKESIMPIYIIVFLVFCFSRFFIPAKMSIIPDLVKKEELLMANSLVTVTGMVAAAVGFGIGGIIVEALGARGGFYLDAATFFVSGILIFFVSTKKKIKVEPKQVLRTGKEMAKIIKKSLAEEVKDVLLLLHQKDKARYVLGLLFLLGAALGSVNVVIIVFIQKSFSSVVKDLGIFAVCLGIGLFCGSILYGKFGKAFSYLRAIFVSLIVSGLLLIIFTLTCRYYTSFMLGASICFLLGVSFSPVMIASYTIVHEIIKSEMQGKIFSGLDIVMHLSFVVFMFLTSYIADRFGQFEILLVVGVSLILIGIVELIRKRDVKII